MKPRLIASIFVALFLLLAGVANVAAQTDGQPSVQPKDNPPNTCYDCHAQLEDNHPVLSQDWLGSVHGNAGVGCADCHGGDPASDEMKQSMSPEAGFIAVPGREAIPQICGGCHSDVEKMRQYNLPTDQYDKYMESVHGSKLKDKETRVAVCTDCHGAHDIKKASDPTADVYPLNVPALCARCHSDAVLMEPFNIPTDQYDIYKTSVHGAALLEKQDLHAPTCTSCHGSHAAKPPASDEVVNVCGRCHTATQNYYEQSLHSRLEGAAPKCWTCHGNHDVTRPDENMFTHPESVDPDCSTCHDPATRELFINKAKFVNIQDRRCDTCHHQESWVNTQVVALKTALTEADALYKEADAAIAEAASRGMIVNDAESKLAMARTSLISARAVVHTTKLTLVTDLTDDAKASAEEAKSIASEKLGENLFRRQAMIVAVGVIMINVSGLYVLKRRMYKELD